MCSSIFCFCFLFIQKAWLQRFQVYRSEQCRFAVTQAKSRALKRRQTLTRMRPYWSPRLAPIFLLLGSVGELKIFWISKERERERKGRIVRVNKSIKKKAEQEEKNTNAQEKVRWGNDHVYFWGDCTTEDVKLDIGVSPPYITKFVLPFNWVNCNCTNKWTLIW